MEMQIARNDNWVSANQTQASYTPNYTAVEQNLAKGQHEMDKTLSRKFLPQGRPMETSNLIELPTDYSQSIKPENVSKGLQSLGHVSQKIISPNMSLNPARDLGYYKATEAIFNVIRDNENI